MELVSKGTKDSKVITFESASSALDSISTSFKLSDEIESCLLSGEIPYTTTKYVPSKYTGEFKDYNDFIAQKLMLDSEKSIKLIELYAGKTDTQFNTVSQNLSFFLSMIIKQQSMLFQISLKVLNSTDTALEKLRSNISQNAFKLIDTLIENIEFISKLQTNIVAEESSNEIDLLILINLDVLLIDIQNYLIYLILRSEKGFQTTSVNKWFELIEITQNLSTKTNGHRNAQNRTTVESLSTLISLLFLDLEHNMGTLDNEASFVNDPKALIKITHNLLNTRSNPIVLYAWSIILHRQHSFLEANKTHPNNAKYIKELSVSPLKNIEMVYLSFVEEAAKLNVCESLLKCNNTIEYDPILPNILGSFVISFVPYIESNYEIVNTIATILKKSSNKIIQKFFDNPFTDELMILFKAKMPTSLDSFLELISINSNLAVEELRLLPSFMTMINTTVFDNAYEIDDQQPELLRLNKDISVSLPFEDSEELSLLMKAGTKCQLISLNKSESLVLFIYEYNGWSLLGRILQNLSVKLNKSDAKKDATRLLILQKLDQIFKDLESNVIELIFNSMDSFTGESDTITTCFKIYEQALFFRNTGLAASCLNLFTTLSQKGYSLRVWSQIFRSDMFTLKANGNLAFNILEKVELSSGNYDFSIALLELGNQLLDMSLIFDERKNQRLKSQVIESFTSYAVKIFENCDSWMFKSDYQRCKLTGLITSYLNKIVKFTTGLQDENPTSLFATFTSSYNIICNSLLHFNTNDLRSIRLFSSLLQGLTNPQMNFTVSSKNGLYRDATNITMFEFTINLLNSRNSRKEAKLSNLENELYHLLPTIIDVYSSNSKYRVWILQLLTQLVHTQDEGKPLSMLSHLKTSHASILLDSLYANISNKDTNEELKISSLRFISTVMENNQKGLSLFLITGVDSFEKPMPTKENDSKKSVFKLLKDVVVGLETEESSYNYHIISALASCLSISHYVGSDDDDLKFVSKILEIIGNDDHSTIYGFETLSKAVEVISLYLFVSNSKNKKCEAKIMEFLNKSEFIQSLNSKFIISERSKSQVLDINDSFSSIFDNELQLKHFVVSNIEVDRSPYNIDSLESLFAKDDIRLADLEELLLKDGEEIKTIQAEIKLAKAYGGLITCFCNFGGDKINTDYCLFSASLLEENYTGSTLNFYDEIYKGRIELSFLVLLTISKLGTKVKNTTLISLLSSTVRLLQSKEVNMFEGLVTLDIDYYRPLMRILLLSISLIKDAEFVSEYSSTLVEIFKNIICKSIVVLLNNIRNQALSVTNTEFGNSPLMNKQIDDVLILLSLLKDFFKLSFDENLDSVLANTLMDTGAYRSVSHMFTSSRLIKINQEEVFMDYSMSFIYEFVQRKSFAEKLVKDGIFHLLTESPIALIIKKGYVTPYSGSSVIVRIHKLWVKKILPVVLTLVLQLSDSISLELCQFAMAFKNQFQYNIQAWLETDSFISQSIIEETEQVIMLAKLLNGLDAYNYVSIELGKNVDDVSLVPGLDNLAERKEFVNALNYLLSHPKYLAMKVRTTDGDITINELTNELKSLRDSLLA